jgi:hypothetical protein
MGELTLPEDLDKDELRQNYQAAMTELDAIVDGTSVLTAAQKTIFFARVLRFVLRLLSKMLG